ncbi:hypothetical protein HK100_007315, partial [Physocladia obscura]
MRTHKDPDYKFDLNTPATGQSVDEIKNEAKILLDGALTGGVDEEMFRLHCADFYLKLEK